MQVITINKQDLLIDTCSCKKTVRNSIVNIFSKYEPLLSKPKDSLILLKPNLNNDLLALTGNSTDLRILAALIQFLQSKGYRNITIADGSNIGIYRKGIDVFSRLGVKALSEHFGVRLLDLNKAPSREIKLPTGPVRVAEICLQADYFISIPKIKTHVEAGISAAVKNLVGCVVGTDKRLVHADLFANIIKLNEIIKPDLILVDGLIGMEGDGPGNGNPKKLDLLLAGKNPFLMDLLIARLIGLDRDNIPYLSIAMKKRYISNKDIARINKLDVKTHFKPPSRRNLITRILDHNYLAKFRDITRFIHGSESFRYLLYRLGIIQDVYEQAEAHIEKIALNQKACDECGICLLACPMELPITTSGFDFSPTQNCIGCLYCFFACPQKAISIEGNLGYLDAHLARYGKQIRTLESLSLTNEKN